MLLSLSPLLPTELSVKQIWSFFLCTLKSVKNGALLINCQRQTDRQTPVNAEYRCPQFVEVQTKLSLRGWVISACIMRSPPNRSGTYIEVYTTERGCGMSSPAHPPTATERPSRRSRVRRRREGSRVERRTLVMSPDKILGEEGPGQGRVEQVELSGCTAGWLTE